jgi:hypothetical protein
MPSLWPTQPHLASDAPRRQAFDVGQTSRYLSQMAEDPGLALVTRCRALEPAALITLYGELANEDPHATVIPALALREKAREGTLDEDMVPLLVALLVDAPNLSTYTHLAKALAAFGRAAEMSSPYLVDRLRMLQITNDRRFWVLDSVLHALSYTGGEAARTFVDELVSEQPARVLRSKSVYAGELDDASRVQIFDETLAAVRARLDDGADLRWREKATTRETVVKEDAPKRTAPWMTR